MGSHFTRRTGLIWAIRITKCGVLAAPVGKGATRRESSIGLGLIIERSCLPQYSRRGKRDSFIRRGLGIRELLDTTIQVLGPLKLRGERITPWILTGIPMCPENVSRLSALRSTRIIGFLAVGTSTPPTLPSTREPITTLHFRAHI